MMKIKKINLSNWSFAGTLVVLFGGCLTVSAQINTSDASYKVKSGEITLQLTKTGEIAGLFIGKSQTSWIISGGTELKGLHISGVGSVKSVQKHGACMFTRTMEDVAGHTCVVTDIFTPGKGSIRWDISITSNDTPWTTAIITRMKWVQPEEKRIWAAWSDPNHSDEKEWHNPFVFLPFSDQQWTYGNQKQSTPEYGDFVSIPMFSIIDPNQDKAVSMILSPEDHLLNLQLAEMKTGDIQFSREKNRIGKGAPIHFTMDIVAHEADWRGGLRFMVSRYPFFFNPVNQVADEMGGCGAYSGYEDSVDVKRLKQMAFRVNWKLSDDFPWMGMFLPPLANANDTWKRACDEPLPLGRDSIQSFRKMNDYSKWMRKDGFYVLNYFNVTEFGRNMNNPPQRSQNDTALWKDPVAFVKYKLPGAVLIPGAATFYGASVMDCGDVAYQQFILQQAERHIKMLPYSAGICIDRMDWLRNDNVHADDGITIADGKPARSLFESWKSLLAKLSPVLHQAKKVIFVNPMAMRLDLMKGIDGFYSEHGESGSGLNSMTFISIRKPAITWTCMWWGTWEQAPKFVLAPDADQFFQRHLLMGVFPTAPYPYNNHAINPAAETDKQYMDYGPLLDAMRGKKWVLAPHCVETTSLGVKVNLFEVPSGYVVPVTFGGTAASVVVHIRNVPHLNKMKATVILPESNVEVPVTGRLNAGVLELNVPIKRGCGMVKLTPEKNK
jgi:hypothetical protein